MERSRSYANGDMMQIESYSGGGARLQVAPGSSYGNLRCYSASYAQTQIGNRDFYVPNQNQLKKAKSTSSKSWNLGDPEFQRRKRVASYKMYGVEGKVKGSFRRSFRWLKNRYTHVVYGWW